MEKIMKYGVVGCIRGAAVAAEGIGDPRAKLVAACDINPRALENARKVFAEKGHTDCIFYDDYDEMLKSDIDAVIVATDGIYHVPIVKKAMEAGKHVLSEIPSINTLEEAYELKKLVSDHPNLIYMTAENCCYWAFIETWKKMREEGQFGDVVYAEAEYLHAIEPKDFAPSNYPEGHWRTINPAIKYITHELGPLLYIMDDKPVTVTCFEPDIIYNPYFPKKKATGVALIKTEKGAVIRILICFGAYTSYDHNYRICGTKGTIETDRLTMVDNAHSYANLSSIPGTFTQKMDIPVTTQYVGEYGGGHGGGDKMMMKDFINCVVNNVKPKLDVDFGIRMSLPGILAHESATKGGIPIDIPEI